MNARFLSDDEFDSRLEHLLGENATPPESFWDRVEAKLFARIHAHSEYDAPIKDCIAEPETPSPSQIRSIEKKVDDRLEKISGLEDWERDLKAEQMLTAGQWEKLEDKLFASIDAKPVEQRQKPLPLWLWLALFPSRPVAKAAALTFAVIACLSAWRIYRTEHLPLDTFVYRAQGSSAQFAAAPGTAGQGSELQAAVSLRGGSEVAAPDKGELTLVNKRGFVEMRDGSRLKIEQANQGNVRYRVAFSGRAASARGRVTFFVNHRAGRQRFQVATPDYRIDVVGTYFRVDPGLAGRYSTSVLEGKVKIHTEASGDFEVGAGQTLAYDSIAETYRIRDGGRTVRREDIDSLPGVEELAGYGLFSVTSDAPGADVRLDGKFRGATPLVILAAPGRHSLQLSREDGAALDTSVAIESGETRRVAVALSSRLHSGVYAGGSTSDSHTGVASVSPPASARAAHRVSAMAKGRKHPSHSVPEKKSPAALSQADEADLIYRRADEAASEDWQSAIVLYRKVLEHPGTGELRKESALFSIARLRADHERDKSAAATEFLRYLALYPDGAFAGESWLRLAEIEVGKNQDKAIGYYLKSLAKFSHHPRLSEIQHKVGLLYLQNRKYDEAIAMFRQSLENADNASEGDKRKIYGSLYRAFVAKGDLKNADGIPKQYRPAD